MKRNIMGGTAMTKLCSMLLVAFLLMTSKQVLAQSQRVAALNFLNKTSYIITEAGDLVYYYNYSTQGYLSKAVNYQSFAKWIYNLGFYNKALQYSNIARQYALKGIYYCDNYWENYYRPYHYSNYRYFNNGYYYDSYRYDRYYCPNQPPHHHNANNNRYDNNRYRYDNNRPHVMDNHSRNNTSKDHGVNAQTRNISRYNISKSGALETKDFDTWNKSYYSSDELSMMKNMPSAPTPDMEKELSRATDIQKVNSDIEARQRSSKEFASDVQSYKSIAPQESQNISISRPEQLGTDVKTTRSTTNQKTNITTTPTNRSANISPNTSNRSDNSYQSGKNTSQGQVKTSPASNQPTRSQDVSSPNGANSNRSASVNADANRNVSSTTAAPQSKSTQTAKPAENTKPVSNNTSSNRSAR